MNKYYKRRHINKEEQQHTHCNKHTYIYIYIYIYIYVSIYIYTLKTNVEHTFENITAITLNTNNNLNKTQTT